MEWNKNRFAGSLLSGRGLEQTVQMLTANAHKDPRATPLQTKYIHASLHREKLKRRRVEAGVAVAFGTTIALAVVALVQRNIARDLAAEARSGRGSHIRP